MFYLQDPTPSQLEGASATTTANSSSKLGTFRRMLNAIRYCFTKRGRSKKPDWLLDKHPHYRSRSKSIPSEDVPSDASTTNILCSHLSVDPSLPSHYRVTFICSSKCACAHTIFAFVLFRCCWVVVVVVFFFWLRWKGIDCRTYCNMPQVFNTCVFWCE